MNGRVYLLAVLSTLSVVGVLAIQHAASAQPPIPAPVPAPVLPPKYNGIVAGWESYLRGEADRRQLLKLQLSTVDTMAWYAGFPTTTPYPPDLESVYAFYPPQPFGPGGRLVYAHRGYPGVFEPWPLVPGDIWGFPLRRRVVQPLADETIATGPNGYIHRPLYASDLKPKQPAPGVSVPEGAAVEGVPLAGAPGVVTPSPGSSPPSAQPPIVLPAPKQPPVESPSDKPAPEAIPAPQPEAPQPQVEGPREF